MAHRGNLFAVHRGTCANRFVDSIIAKGAFKPSKRLSMPIEVITSNLEAGKLKGGAAMWEPHARRVVEAGHARYVATGAPWGETDADFTLMRQDFIENHPEAAIGWMKAEIEAMQFIVNNPEETVEILYKELTGYPKATIWSAIYEENPASIGGDPVTYEAKMIFDEDVLTLMNNGYALPPRVEGIEIARCAGQCLQRHAGQESAGGNGIVCTGWENQRKTSIDATLLNIH